MDFNFTEEQIMIRDTVAKFAEKEIAPYAMEWDEKNETPMDTVRKFHEVGLFNYAVPEEYGGPGLDEVSKWLIGMELAKGDAGFSTTIGVSNTLAPEPVMIAGTH
ncbi:MAG: acyl-CoA dehydrogenase family protein, partial [Firmicutes bacterium]|nr:acyl-CoA dehydrogenase family protein [Bacillota bacterium]